MSEQQGTVGCQLCDGGHEPTAMQDGKTMVHGLRDAKEDRFWLFWCGQNPFKGKKVMVVVDPSSLPER